MKNNDIRNEIAKNIKFLLQTNKLELKDLAKATNINLRTLQRSVSNETNTNIVVLYNVADYFGVSIDFLVGRVAPTKDMKYKVLKDFKEYIKEQK